ncbi:30S ribosomal protein S6 modification protein [Vibrio albus]|jgi:hypothetical protein|uniref:30S ribosomal protein S6 modification protein n=1 Tax=Vibrio albus TaxID=2200953 RepID=A0A2U3BDD1_9VIBR|nr:30S ribosomal protein S6 modification protein [Vibrio albus]PWI34791.1 30S ribosomal protein S6 modification protein [Vibrio albus]
MLSQSRIEVWYKVAGERILLGETCSSDKMDVINLWVSLPHDNGSPEQQGYYLSLFADDGRCIGEKPVTLSDAESVLERQPKYEPIHSSEQLAFL